MEVATEDTHFEALSHPGHLVRRLHQICVGVFLDVAKDFQLTHVQYATLVAINHRPGIDQASLGRLIALDRQTTSNVVTRLCQKGLIERKQKDKRTSALYLLGAAKALMEVMESRTKMIDEAILKPLTGSERDTFMALLIKLVNVNNELSRVPYSPTGHAE